MGTVRRVRVSREPKKKKRENQEKTKTKPITTKKDVKKRQDTSNGEQEANFSILA